MNCITKDWWYTAIVVGMVLAAAWVAFSISGCASVSHAGKAANTGKRPDCDGNQCKRQTTPEQVLKRKPLVYY